MDKWQELKELVRQGQMSMSAINVEELIDGRGDSKKAITADGAHQAFTTVMNAMEVMEKEGDK